MVILRNDFRFFFIGTWALRVFSPGAPPLTEVDLAICLSAAGCEVCTRYAVVRDW